MNLHDRFIKHDQFRDVCFKVTWCLDVGRKLKLKGRWWSMAFVESFDIFRGFKDDKITIRKEDLVNWKMLPKNQQLLACLRDGKWESISVQNEPK